MKMRHIRIIDDQPEPPDDPSIFGFVAILILIVLGSNLFSGFITDQLINKPKKTTQERLQEISKTINTAAITIGDIEVEIAKTKDLVDELEQKKTTYEELINTDRQQVEAIALLLGQEQRKENNKAFYINFLIGILTNVATGFALLYLEYRTSFFRRYMDQRAGRG